MYGTNGFIFLTAIQPKNDELYMQTEWAEEVTATNHLPHPFHSRFTDKNGKNKGENRDSQHLNVRIFYWRKKDSNETV